MSRGPTVGPRRVPVRGPRLAHPTGGTTPTIYDQLTAADLNAFLQQLLGSAADFTPSALWPASTSGVGAATFVEVVAGNDLVGQAGALTVASPHGAAMAQVHSGAYWAVADAAALDVTTNAVAVLGHIYVPAATAGAEVFVGKGGPASAHYTGTIDAAGQLGVNCKQFGAPTTATIAGDITGAYRWLLPAARSITDADILAALDGADATAAFSTLLTLATAGAFNFGNNTTGGATSDCEWLAVFLDAPAESIIANRAALLAALEATP